MPSVAWAQQAGPGPAPGGLAPLATTLFPFVLILLVFYFLMIRPQKKQQLEHQKMLEALKKGDHVLTSGGMFGTVVGVQKDRVVLKVAENVKVEYQKSAVASVLDQRAEASKGDSNRGDSGE